MVKGHEIFARRSKTHHESGGSIDKYVKKEVFTKEMFEELLEKKPDNRRKSIYVHTPYCDKICSFCNLNRKQLEGSLDSYAEYIASEFDKYGKTVYFKESEFEVIFFGGGTPSVYKKNQLEVILSAIERNVKLKDDYEFTFETTLHNLTKEKLDVMMKYGVNRLSVGIQSFCEKGRKFYNRTFDKSETIKRLRELKKYFKGHVCVDIIYNFPGQTIEEVKEDARIVKELEIDSASFYSLIISEGSTLSAAIKKGDVVIDDSIERDQEFYEAFLNEMLNGDNYHILELTKIARNGGDNYKYIRVGNSGGDTFPIGVGAGGGVQGAGAYRMSKEMSFYSKSCDLKDRFRKLAGIMQFPVFSKERLQEVLTEEEYKYFAERMQYFKEHGLILENEDSFELTKDGVYWGNSISSDTNTYIVESIFGERE